MSSFKSFNDALHYAGFQERDRQREVFDSFRAGKHVILHAPTGWGKTFAVLAALAEGHAIYSLPMRVLVDSLVEDAQKRTFKRCVAHHGARREHELLDKGDDPVCPIDVVFTTLDQSLSAFLGIPVGVSIRQGNILPAVIDASHLIFDEFHLFDPERSWRTAMYAITQSRQNGIILTATLSDVMVQFLEEELGRTVVGNKNGVALIRGNRPFVNKKIVQRGSGLDNLQNLATDKRTIVIRNQIEWAKRTARQLRESMNVPVYLLHSELLPDDRRATEDAVRIAFAKNAQGPAILVSTQVVEAGIDITCDELHTDSCPPASFIQRAGRCARYVGETGQIYWHPAPEAAPYQNQADTIACLDSYLGDECELTPETEKEIVNLAADNDRKVIENYRRTNGEITVREVRVLRNYAKYGELIRHINNVNVAIGDNLNQRYKFISISRGSFFGNGRFANVPGTKYVRFDSERKEYETVSRPELADFVLLDPEYVGYVPDYGLKIGAEGGESYFIDDQQKQVVEFKYILEPYALHLQRLWEQKRVVRWMIEKLAEVIGNADNAEYLVDFVIWAHDLGKLNLEWQAAHGVPSKGIPPEHFPLAFRPSQAAPLGHSDDDINSPYRRQKSPPSHAWISAWSVWDLLVEITKGRDGLRRAVFWAIADHHGYLMKNGEIPLDRFQPYQMGYLDYLEEMSQNEPWKPYGWHSGKIRTSASRKVVEELRRRSMAVDRLRPSDELGVYYMLSYILRRCDQLATSLTSTKVKRTIEPPEVGGFI